MSTNRNTGLIAHNGALKRVKCESRGVGRPKSMGALKRDLCANLQKMCEACANAAFEVRNHPYLPGVRCRSDGNVWVPPNGPRPGHWTFGCTMVSGYKEVVIRKQHFYVHRLMAETFLQCPIPEGMQIDHINRDKSLNVPSNIRITTPSGNQRNRAVRDASLARYGVSQVDEGKKSYDSAYQRWHWANDPAFREKRRAAAKRWRDKKKEKEAGNGD